MHAYEEMLAGYVDPDASYPEADPDSSLFECKLCCKCLRIMSLCYSSIDLAIQCAIICSITANEVFIIDGYCFRLFL